MRTVTFNVYRHDATQSVNAEYTAKLRNSEPLQIVDLTHVKGSRWVRDFVEYTLKPTNSKQTYITVIKNKPYVLIATVLAGQVKMSFRE